jgi:hypothetical protein
MVRNLLKGYITACRDFLKKYGNSHLVREVLEGRTLEHPTQKSV